MASSPAVAPIGSPRVPMQGLGVAFVGLSSTPSPIGSRHLRARTCTASDAPGLPFLRPPDACKHQTIVGPRRETTAVETLAQPRGQSSTAPRADWQKLAHPAASSPSAHLTADRRAELAAVGRLHRRHSLAGNPTATASLGGKPCAHPAGSRSCSPSL